MKSMPYSLSPWLLSLLLVAACSEDSGAGAPGTSGASDAGPTASGSVTSIGSVSSSATLTTGTTSGDVSSSGSGSAQTSSLGSTTGAGTSTTGAGGGSSASGSDTSSSATSGATTGTSGSEGETLEDGSPLLLSQTGLYEADMVTLAEGVRPFEPRFALWSDEAAKKRWIWLPEGTQIDTSDMDYWLFPVGTRVFKEFSRDGVRVETRMMTKRERGGWQRVAYQWRDNQSEADALLEGGTNASGTDHDIPSQEDCGTCHFRTPDKVLGFSAIQLAWDNPDPDAWTLARLTEEERLTNAPPAIQLPGTETATAALGYMHANCGHCHNPQSSVTTRVTVSFWLSTGALGSVEETPPYTTSVCKDIELEEGSVPGADKIIDPGSPETSALFLRVDSRGETYSMPTLGTELVDMDGRRAIQDWILSLDGIACE